MTCFQVERCGMTAPQLLINSGYDNTPAKDLERKPTAALLIALPLSRRVQSLSRAFLNGLGSLGR